MITDLLLDYFIQGILRVKSTLELVMNKRTFFNYDMTDVIESYDLGQRQTKC